MPPARWKAAYLRCREPRIYSERMKALWLCLVCGVAACGGGAEKCKVGETSCDGTCVDVLSSNTSCGACGSACSAAQVCGNGTCADDCPVNQVNCNGTCSDTTSD